MRGRLARWSIFASMAVLVGVRVHAQCPAPAWASLDPAHPLNASVNALVEWDQDGAGPQPPTLVAGGGFNLAGTMPLAPQVATWDGTSWTPLGSGITNGLVLALFVHNGDLIAAGGFYTIGGVSANHVARWNGTTWAPLGAGLNSAVYSLGEHNGELVAGGAFSVVGGSPAEHIARWNGSSWQPFGAGLNGSVYTIAHYDGDLVVGGAFNATSQTQLGRFARWDGSTWVSLGLVVSTVHASTDYQGKLVVTGDHLLAQWDGAQWQSLGGFLDGGASVGSALATYAGELILSGDFNSVAGVAANSIARWNGACWQPLGAGLFGAFTWSKALAAHEGALFAGGDFLSAGGMPALRIAQWTDPVPVIALSQPAGPGGGVVVANENLIPGHEYYNIASFELCPGCIGSGPFGGLCFSDLGFLLVQLAYPVGWHPFHFVPTSPTSSSGPYGAPIGASFEAVCADVTGGVLGCTSHVARFTVQ
jgi:hypothetical protein